MSEGSVIKCVGVDVAAGGDAMTVAAVRVGWAVLRLHCWREADTMTSVSTIVSIARALPADLVVIDATGVGAGVYDRLRELELPVLPFNGGEGTDRTDASGAIRFLNKRAAAWWNLREKLHPYHSPPITLPNDPELLRDLVAPRYRTDAQGGKLAVERKSEVVKRLGRSPDRGDAVVMAFWGDDDGGYEESYALHTEASIKALREETEREEREQQREAARARGLDAQLWKQQARGRWLLDRW